MEVRSAVLKKYRFYISIFLSVVINVIFFLIMPETGMLMKKNMSLIKTRSVSFTRLPEHIRKEVQHSKKTVNKREGLIKRKVDIPVPEKNINFKQISGKNIKIALAEYGLNYRKPEPAFWESSGMRDAGIIYTIDTIDKNPVFINRVKPEYPVLAEKLGISGKVIVEFVVDINGKPGDIKIIESSPPGIFEKSVIRAVKRSRFIPGEKSGSKVKVRYRMPVTFKLEP